MAICPSPRSEEFEKVKKVVGENVAYALWNRNNGHPINETPTGEHSVLYSQLIDIYRSEEAAIRAKANIYTDAFLANNNWLATGQEPVFDNIEKEPSLTPTMPQSTDYRRNVIGEELESFTNDPVLEEKLVNFLSGLNVTTEFKEDLKESSEFNAESLSDLLYKLVQVKKGTDIKNFAKEAAYIAYSFLGRKNKIRTDLVHSIESIPDYTRIFNEYKARYPDYHPLKIKEFIVIDFLADAIINNYKAPKKSYIQRDPEYWGITGNSALIKRLKYLLMKFKFFMQRVLNSSRLSSREVEALFDDIANDILRRNYGKFSAELAPEVQLVNYEETIEKDATAKEITEYIQSIGGILTGSLALRKQGTLYRDFEKETLHDLDFSLPVDIVNKEIEKALEIDLPTNFFALSEEEQEEVYRNAKTIAMKKLMGKMEDFSLIKQIKKKYPNAFIQNAFAGLKAGEYTVTLNINDMAVDLFFVNDTTEELGAEGFQNWEAIFQAKIKMGRAKDLTDFANFVPFSLKSRPTVATDKGFRHFTFGGNNQSNLEEQSRVVQQAYERQAAVLKSAMPQVEEVIYDDTIDQVAYLEPGG